MDSVDRVSDHYRQQRGAAYVAARQSDPNYLGYAINASYFEPFIGPGDSVLDFGCGNGGMLVHLARMAAEVEGLEVNDAARQIALESGFTVHASLAEMPEDRVYDVIVSNHVLEHVPNVCEVLQALRRHLRPGGLFVAKLPIDDIRSRHQRSWSRDDVDHHLQTWTPRLFANVLFESGYDVRGIRIVTSAWHPRLFPLLKIGLGKLAFRALAVLKHRRQLLAVATVPAADPG